MKNVLRHVPHKMSKQRVDQPWLTPDLKRRCKKKHRLYNKWKKAKTKDTSCRQAREAYKKYQQETNHLLQKARYQYINRILDEGLKEDSTKPFWNYIRHQRTEDTGVAPLKQNGQVYSDPGGGGGGGGGGVLGLKTDGGVPLAAENWTQKDRGKNWIWAKKIDFCKNW